VTLYVAVIRAREIAKGNKQPAQPSVESFTVDKMNFDSYNIREFQFIS
jgi:hypothetical protein